MDSVGVNVIETAALGRPFQLGMLYDCRKDALIPGITLWDEEQLQQSIRTRPQINTSFKVTASDSIEDKSNILNIDSCLKLSLLGGLLHVSGAAKYLNDTKKSFKQQRLTLHYHSTSKFEKLSMNHLASGNITHHEVFENDTATHVVTAVLYGADACFVFDREVSSDENEKTVAGEVQVALDKLKGISVGANINLNMNDNQKTAVEKFSCTFYGDFQLLSNPASFEDALKIYAELPKLLGENKELVVPLRVWLFPLDKLHTRTAKLQRNIRIDLMKNFIEKSVIESLSAIEMKCSDLLKDTPALTFAVFNDKIQNMKQNCCNYKLSLMEKLGIVLPKIRGDMEKDTALTDLLHEHEESPFRGSNLEQWLKEKENESDVFKTLLRQLNDFGAKVEINIDTSLMDLEVENVVCYTFTSFERSDVLLSKQMDYLSPSSRRSINESPTESKQNKCLTPEIKNTMRNNLKLFKSLINSKDRKPAKFIISSKEMANNPGSCILLYENGSDEAVCFTPPSKPDSPIVEQARDGSVVLKVPSQCPATVELRLLYKIKEGTDWNSRPVLPSHDTVTLTDLSPDTEYEIKCAAVGKLNYIVDSDVVKLRFIDKNLIRATESIIEHLILTENKCSELLGDPRVKTFSAFQKKIDDMRRYCQTYKQCLNGKIKSLIVSVQACEKKMCALIDLLQAHEESPFKESGLVEWITIKEQEMKTIDEFLQCLLESGAEMDNRFDTFLSDDKAENLLCYTFSSLEQPDGLLTEQEHYLKPQTIRRNLKKTPHSASQTWLTGDIRLKMRTHLKMFKELMASNSNQSTKFIVSSKDHKHHPGSCILLYEKGSDEAVCFTPPSKPDSPIVEQARDGSVVLKVLPQCPATVELRLLYKMKEETEWKSQPVLQSQDTVTLTDLSPDTEYEIKCAAVGKLNYNVYSDAIRVIRERTTRNKGEQQTEFEDYCRITQKDLEDLKESISTQDLPSAINTIEEYLKKQDLVELNIGVTGESGSGKSTFVNAFRGLGDEDEGSAKTGPVETTMEPEVYFHPKYKNVKVWDLPGIGTPNFKADEYLELVQFEHYDFFIIIASEQFRECHTQLAKEIMRMGKKFYFVRTKIDSTITAEKRKKNFDQKKTLDTIREDCENGLKKIGIEDAVVFLISSFELSKYDLNQLQERMEKELPQHKRRVLLLPLMNITLEINEKKKKALEANIGKVAFLSACVATVPLPGLSFAVDLAIVKKEAETYYSTFGLDDPSLQKLCERYGKTIEELKSLMKSPLRFGINSASLLALLGAASLAVDENAVEYVVSLIPIIGSLMAGGMSYMTVSTMLKRVLNDIAEDARNVLIALLETM
ncbi:uncharacterized protein si:dkey-79i2.4 isoform X2 [Chanodichthys erythropterus]|uniref:uncharacterized protein si:dkey-79i2.4 isoform X2 n=1 Tax=Chanodichthys erythropterus TaxID=933992 RepID=UPI00351F2C15